MPVVVYVDENGDHSLEAVDPHFPIFVLTMMIADVKGYYEKIVPAICQLKVNHFGHEGVIISVVIRKQAHKDKYGKAARNPYDLAFTFALERLLLFSKAMTRPKCS